MKVRRQSDPWIGWTTVSYRSMMAMIAGCLAVVCLAVAFLFPSQARSGADGLKRLFASLRHRLDRIAPSSTADRTGLQANFTAIEGSVRIKRHNDSAWVEANFNQPLEKGDVVQTGADGIAKIVFADGTNYVLKQDSLIVIEENSTNPQQQTKVSVQVTTGTVDLATATFAEGSSSKVVVAGATASFSPESAAQVRNSPREDKHEIVVSHGGGEVQRNGEVLHLGDFERVSFSQTATKMTKVKEIGPPILISPANMMPVFTNNAPKPVVFSWTPVSGTAGYRLRISRNPYFTSTVYDKIVNATEVTVPQLREGAYYWLVQSVEGSGRESVESEKNRFTIIAHTVLQVALTLELDPFIQHGHVLEVRGRTEPTARVMVNGAEVPLISSDGSFRFFTHPLPNGENLITVTAQDARGGVNTKQQAVSIQ